MSLHITAQITSISVLVCSSTMKRFKKCFHTVNERTQQTHLIFRIIVIDLVFIRTMGLQFLKRIFLFSFTVLLTNADHLLTIFQETTKELPRALYLMVLQILTMQQYYTPFFTSFIWYKIHHVSCLNLQWYSAGIILFPTVCKCKEMSLSHNFQSLAYEIRSNAFKHQRPLQYGSVLQPVPATGWSGRRFFTGRSKRLFPEQSIKNIFLILSPLLDHFRGKKQVRIIFYARQASLRVLVTSAN